MSSASSHSEVTPRKPSGSCLIHPSISSSSSDYDEGEEFDLFSESLKEPNPEDLLVRPTPQWCPGIVDSNLFSSKRKVYYTFEDGPVYLVYPVHLFLFSPVSLYPDMQLSSISLPTNHLRTLCRFKSKSRSNPHLSSNAFSHSFPPDQIHHHKCLPQGRESLCVHPHQQTAIFRPSSHLKTANNLKLKHLESTPRSLNPKLRPTDPNQYLIQVFCHISAFLLMWVRGYPHIVYHPLLRISSP